MASPLRPGGIERPVLGVLSQPCDRPLGRPPGRSVPLVLPAVASTPTANRVPPEPAEQFPAWSRRCTVHDFSLGWPLTAAREYGHRRCRPRHRLRAAGSVAGGSGGLLRGGGDARIRGCRWRRPGSGRAKQCLSPSRRSTRGTHRVDAPVPAATSVVVTTVDSVRNMLVGLVTIGAARSA
jgi:hypothetical protein